MPSFVESPRPLPSTVDLSKYPKLSAEQAGHLRHFYNISAARDGEWPHMGTDEPMQEFVDAYRYQLATMVYASALAHYHRLPAMRGLFKPLIERLVHKMLRQEVWGYWFMTSHSGNRLDPDLTKLREPWADPIVRENIMYSGHLLLMTSLYAMLFDDDKYEQLGSLTFSWAPLFWGMGPEVFKYDNRSMQAGILAEMEKNGWAGVCCEPNVIFVVCNQFPIIAMHLNDSRDGTNVAEEVLEKYQAALLKKNMISTEQYFVDMVTVKRGDLIRMGDVAFTAWAGAFMNTWNSDFVRKAYPAHIAGSVTSIEGEIRLHDAQIVQEMGRIAAEDKDAPLNTRANLERAIESFRVTGPQPGMLGHYVKPTYGYVVQWLSELGKQTELEGLLKYADDRLQPTWENGGLYYPRNDQAMDINCDWTYMDPYTGNAGIAYARLNIEDGQKKMYEKPWTRKDLASRPYVDGLDLAAGVDCLRGTWDEAIRAMVITLKSWDLQSRSVAFSVKNLPPGAWEVYENGFCSATQEIEGDGGEITVTVDLQHGKETDIVVYGAR